MHTGLVNNTRTAVYYPYFTISTPYLKQMLLYWDEVASIIPEIAEDNKPDIYSPEMEYLKSQSIFKPIRPEEFLLNPINYDQKKQLRTEFRSILDSISSLPESPFNTGSMTPFHKGKKYAEFDTDIQERLLLLSLSNPAGYDLINQHIGYIYMSLLAKYISNDTPNYVVPITDIKSSRDLIYFSERGMQKTAFINLVIKDILPLPTDDIAIDDILQFKKRRQEELTRFRQCIDDLSVKISSSSSKEELRHTITTSKEAIEVGIYDLQRTLKESRISFLTGTIESLIQMAPSLVSSYCATVNAADKVPYIKDHLGIGAATLATAYVGTKYVGNLSSQRSQLKKSQYSYLMQTHEKFG